MAVAALAASLAMWSAVMPPTSAQVVDTAAHPDVFADNFAGTAVSVETLLAHSREHAPALVPFRADLVRAQGAMAVAGVRFAESPTLEASVGSRVSEGAAGVDAEVGVWQTLDPRGPRQGRQDLARAQYEAATTALHAATWEVAQQVMALATTAMLQARARQTYAEQLAAARAYADALNGAVAAGETAPLAALLAETDVLAAAQQVTNQEAAILQTRRALAETVGWNAAMVPPLLDRLPTAVDDVAMLSTSTAAAPPTDDATNPLLRACQATVAVEVAQEDLTVAERWVPPRVGLAYGHEGALGVEAAVHTVTVGVEWALPLRRAHTPRVEAAAAAHTNARAACEQLAVTLVRQREAATADLVQQQVLRAQLEATAPTLAAQIETLVTRQHALGDEDIFAVLAARRARAALQQQRMTLDAAVLQAAVALATLLHPDATRWPLELP